jgi:FkbM family methyltransferase
MISYTRNFEDVMLARALQGVSGGFYVDVGASHPVSDSNTYALYNKGWRGIAIEPQPIFNSQWQSLRPEDMLVNAAVAAASGQATLHKPIQYGQGATIHLDLAKGYAQQGLAMAQSVVPVHTLTEILSQLRPHGDIHLLSIDVEGAESDALLGLDLQRFRPWLVVLESVLPGLPTPNYEAWEPILLAAGYEFAYFDAVNRFYVAKEHLELKAHFDHPPCVWDEFESHEVVSLRQQVQTQQEQINAMAHSLLGCAQHMEALGDLVAYEQMLRKIFELAPAYEDIYWPLGRLLTGQGRRAEALAFYQETIKHAPLHFYSHHNIGMLMRWEKRWEESEAAFRRMMEIKPDFSEGRMNFGALLLALGRYPEGWALFESRYLVNAGETPHMSHNAPYPRWTGEPLAGKSIIIMREQGYGDEIMFARFAQSLKERGAARVTILCQPLIRTLLQTVPGVDDVVCSEDLTGWPHMDYWCYGQSLPHALGITLDTLPAAIPYITPQTTPLMAWHKRITEELPAGTFKVGITWRGSPKHGNDHNRSLANLHVLRPLWDVPNVSFVSLQTGDAALEAANSPPDQPIAEWGSQMSDFADGAALVAQLDLIISVDTGIVHVAGALGVPCWVMIPRIETDWRWLNDRDDSPWYPKGMRIFRQTTASGWDDVLENIKNSLLEMASSPAEPSSPAESSSPRRRGSSVLDSRLRENDELAKC